MFAIRAWQIRLRSVDRVDDETLSFSELLTDRFLLDGDLRRDCGQRGGSLSGGARWDVGRKAPLGGLFLLGRDLQSIAVLQLHGLAAFELEQDSDSREDSELRAVQRLERLADVCLLDRGGEDRQHSGDVFRDHRLASAGMAVPAGLRFHKV